MNVKTLCLGILHFGEATGYEIKHMASEGAFSHFMEASYGSIYPALTRLTADGLVVCREEHQPGKPSRKVYAITPAGRDALVTALHDEPRPDVCKSEFVFVTLFADLVDRRHIQELVDRRIVDLQDEEKLFCDALVGCDRPETRFAIGYGIAMNRAALAYLNQNRALLDAVTSREDEAKSHQAEEMSGEREAVLAGASPMKSFL